MKNIITIVTALLLFSACKKDSVVLKLNYEKGDKYITNVETIQTGPSNVNMTMVMETVVVDNSDNKVVTENKFSKMVYNAEGGGKKISYNSEDKVEDMAPESKMMHEQMKNLLDATVTMTYSENGKLLDATSTTGNADIFKQINGMEYPKEEIKVGFKWSDSKDLPGGAKSTTNYLVKSIEEDKVTIDVSGVIEGMLKGDIKGKSVIETKTGNILSSDIVTTMKMGAQEMKASVKVNSKKV